MEKQNVVSQKTQIYIDSVGERYSFIIRITEKWDSEKELWFVDSVTVGYPEGVVLMPPTFKDSRIVPPDWELVEETDDFYRRSPLDVVQYAE